MGAEKTLKTVLHIEDDKIPRMMVERFFKGYTYQGDHVSLIQAANGIEALEELSRTHIDLLLVDRVMPIVSGEELARLRSLSGSQAVAQIGQIVSPYIRSGSFRLDYAVRRLCAAHFIFLTSRGSIDDIGAMMRLGVDRVLTKPMHPSELRESLDQYLALDVAKYILPPVQVDRSAVSRGYIRV